MTPEKLEEAKIFKRDTGIMSIVLWVFVAFLICLQNPETIDIASLVVIGAIILTFIHFKMKGLIKEYERMNNGK